MSMFIPYRTVDYLPDRNSNSQQVNSNPSFVSLLEFVSEIYEVSVGKSVLYIGEHSLDFFS